MRIKARSELWNDAIDVLMFVDDGQRSVVTELKLEPIKDGTYCSPSFSLTPQEAQEMMNELWACGIRPHNGQGGPAQVEAMRDHLRDLQRVVFKNYPDTR